MQPTCPHSNPLTDSSFDAPSLAKMLGRNVKALRKSEHITKTRFAAMVGIGRPLLNKIENGTADVRLSRVEDLASALDTTAEYLLFGKHDVLHSPPIPPIPPTNERWPLEPYV